MPINNGKGAKTTIICCSSGKFIFGLKSDVNSKCTWLSAGRGKGPPQKPCFPSKNFQEQ